MCFWLIDWSIFVLLILWTIVECRSIDGLVLFGWLFDILVGC